MLQEIRVPKGMFCFTLLILSLLLPRPVQAMAASSPGREGLTCSEKNRQAKKAGAGVSGPAATVEWDEYQEVDVPYSPREIQLVFRRGEGSLPDGYMIWRRDLTAGEGRYKKLGRVDGKRGQDGFTYRDCTVRAMHRYRYRIRAYRIVEGKILYGRPSEEVTMRAVRQKPVLSCSLVKPLDPGTGELELMLRSGRHNGRLVLDKDGYCMDSCKTAGGAYIEYAFRLTAFSADGIRWTRCTDHCALKQNSTLFLRFTLLKRSLRYAGAIKKDPVIYTSDGVSYNGLISELKLRPVRGRASVSLNGELYH